MIGRTNAACNSGELHGAAISVTTEETTLIGKEVTLSKDSIVVDTKTVDDNGACSFTDIQDPGDYTVSASDGTDSTSETVTITSDNIVNKTVLSCVLSLIPDGSTVTPVDDVAVWLKCAGSKAGYTTTAEVLADSNTMFSLTSDENAMKYLERSTSFADDLCADETFMTYLGQSPYVDGTVLNSDLWVTKIKASPYKWLVLEKPVYPFSTASDTDLAKMLDAYYSGDITIDDIKTKNSVGDTRSVSLSAMSATGVGESHRAQTVQLVILDFEHDDLATAINGHSKAAVSIGLKDCLMDASNASNPVNGSGNTENGYMNSSDTNAGGWKNCARRAWCNNVFFAALPSAWRSMVKTVNKKVSIGNNSSIIETVQDKIFLAAEIEIFNSTTYSSAGEGTQYQYYKNATANRYKMPKWESFSVTNIYWERSPAAGGDTAGFCRVNTDGGAGGGISSGVRGLAPCLCI